jgi:acyl carrier protein
MQQPTEPQVVQAAACPGDECPRTISEHAHVDGNRQHGYNRLIADRYHTHARRRNMDVYAKVKDIVVELLEVDPDEVTRDASFRDTLEADSLDLVELLMAFEDEFGATIPDEDVKQINTVGDAVDYIARRVQEES